MKLHFANEYLSSPHSQPYNKLVYLDPFIKNEPVPVQKSISLISLLLLN